ncbi:hypothetical protein BJ875DRAFT_487481 [Amylocarpus encephaloides]|uniref:Uncharacterized protein n=1 Tax=Amylocarpus encephaloides TaxID=45428 RepID=A0A9P8C225_9HELO|nr:hypothetical protein BJ875DRAFT_487481 [Amylocarpus encephaloides]
MSQLGFWSPGAQKELVKSSAGPRDSGSNVPAARVTGQFTRSQLDNEAPIAASGLPPPAWKIPHPPSFNRGFPSFLQSERDPFRDSSDSLTPTSYFQSESLPYPTLTPKAPTSSEAFSLARSTPKRRSRRRPRGRSRGRSNRATYPPRGFQAPQNTSRCTTPLQGPIEPTDQGDINSFEREVKPLIVVIGIAPYYLESLQETGFLVAPSTLANRTTGITSAPGVVKRTRLLDPLEDMAPGYRTQNRRQNRTGYVDHDVFEGLPVRQWRRDLVHVAPQPEQDNSKAHNDIWAVELPYGMPKDSHLLPQHSQDLLRAARSGRIYKRPPQVEEEENYPEVSEKQEKKEDDSKDRGFSARAWKQVARQQEGPDIEHLAKRRKGLVTHTKLAPPVPTVVRTTVRRTDAAGNQYTQDVVVPHGQQVDGEVVSQTVVPDPSAPRTAGSFAPQPTPPRPKKLIQRKKTKGPGRGKRKKPLPPTSVPQVAPIDGAAPVGGGSVPTVSTDGVQIEGEPLTAPAKDEDTEMGEGSMAASDEEDGDEDGDEGDDDEGSIADLNSPSKPPRTESPIATPLPTMKEIPDINPAIGFMPPGHHLPAHLERQNSEGTGGSPLKNVALATSALTSPVVAVPSRSPEISSANESTVNTSNETVMECTEILKVEPESLGDALQMDVAKIEVAEAAPLALPSPPAHLTDTDLKVAEQIGKEEEGGAEEMLLDIVENTNNAQISGDALPEALAPVEVISEVIPREQLMEAPEVVTEAPIVETSVDSPVEEPVAATEEFVEATDEPVAATQEFVEVTEEPVLATEEFVEAADEPVAATDGPIEATEEPVAATGEIVKATDGPDVAMEEPKQVSPEEVEAPEPIPQTIAEPVSQPIAETTPPPQPTANEDDDDDFFPDLLGGLEKSLNLPPPRPATLSEKPKSPPPSAEVPGDAEDGEEEEKPMEGSQA